VQLEHFVRTIFLLCDKDKNFIGKGLLKKKCKQKDSTMVTMKDSIESYKVTAGRKKRLNQLVLEVYMVTLITEILFMTIVIMNINIFLLETD
jgi:hypothetical protein